MKKRIFSVLKDFLQILISSALIVFISSKFLFFSAEVVGTSMYPTLQDGDRGFSFIILRNIEIKRFDICVVDSNKTSDLLIKRVIGLPNETVEYKNNKLYINGEYIKEDFLDDDVFTNDFSYTLKDGEYFCLGDNREVSRDSRYYGSFTKEEIISTSFFAYYPFNRFGSK